MTTPQDREPEPPRWDAPPQPPAWDRPADGAQGWGPPPGPAVPSPYAGAGSPAPGGPGHTGPPRTSTKAVVALVLAIAAYTPTVPFLGAIAALVVSRMARRDIEASGGAQTGIGLCRTANVLAVVHLVLIALLVLLLAALFVLPFSVS